MWSRAPNIIYVSVTIGKRQGHARLCFHNKFVYEARDFRWFMSWPEHTLYGYLTSPYTKQDSWLDEQKGGGGPYS